MLEKLKELIKSANEYGIPLPLLRDPKVGPSVSYTMLVMSFSVVLFGLIGKMSKILGDVNLEQAMYLFIACQGLYFGRTLTYTGKSLGVAEQKPTENKDNNNA